MSQAWIIATDSRVGALVAQARNIADRVNVVAVGDVDALAGVDAITTISQDENTPVEVLAPAVANAIAADAEDVIFVPNSSAGRVLGGAVAAKLGAPIFTHVSRIENGTLEVARFGGITNETVNYSGNVVVVMDGGEPVESGDLEVVSGVTDGAYQASVTGTNTVEVSEVNLAAAKKIVAIGRGLKAEEDLSIVRDLASALGAEVACTRPLAEGQPWLPKTAYIGVSGAHVRPDLYVAAGISGQMQHTVGAQDSKTIVVINSDANAPYFKEADYGIVGDLYEVLPALTEALK